MRKRGVVVTAWIAGCVVTQAASAQGLRGRLLDLSSNEPLVAGLVSLLASDGTTLLTAITDRDGYWVLTVPKPGSYFVAAQRIGYQRWITGPLTLSPDEDVNSVYHLQRLPVVLDPVDVSAAAVQRYLAQTGFYDRQRADFGHFVSPEDIERRQATRVTELLSAIPGVNLVAMTTGSVGARFVQLRGSNLSQGGACRPRVYVDGLLYALGDSRPKGEEEADVERRAENLRQLDQGMSLDDIGPPSNIAAIEVYRSASQVPVRFGGTSIEAQCGVIVVWTRTGTARTSP